MKRELALIALMTVAAGSHAESAGGRTYSPGSDTQSAGSESRNKERMRAGDQARSDYADAVRLELYRIDTSPYETRASDLIGHAVRNPAGDEIGDIDDLVVSRGNKRLYAVISVGGLLGLGDKLVAVPYSDLRMSRDGEYVFINATEADLEDRPEFVYNEGERTAMLAHVTRYDAMEQGETARNQRSQERAQQKRATDPSAQGVDAETIREIRQSMLADESLSIKAYNVKIMPEGDHLTLRGSVESAKERERLLAIAKAHAGKHAVNNEIEVASNE